MIISIINHTDGQLRDEEVQRALRAIQRQIKEDFEPHWSLAATFEIGGQVYRQAKATARRGRGAPSATRDSRQSRHS